MDSITQITLGAAVGEAVLGKKLGNRAMVWGGIAGTIPDLDVFASGWMTEMESLAFHRGPSHSLLFAVLFPWLIAAFTHWLYGRGTYQKSWYKWSIYFGALAVLSLFIHGIISFFSQITGSFNWLVFLLLMVVLIGVFFLIGRSYLTRTLDEIDVSYKEWVWFFFLTIGTHSILDSFTSYGTQLLWPFSDMRVAWDNISVADPFYTAPFLICLITACFFRRGDRRRAIWNWAGIIISSLYMIWTFYNQSKATKVFESYLNEREISYEELKVSPSILNNFLWFGVARSGQKYYRGWWSTLDARAETDKMFEIQANHDIIEPYLDDPDVEIMTWFSDGFYQVEPVSQDSFHYFDVRYGWSQDTVEYEPQSVFGWGFKIVDGEFELGSEARGPDGNFSSMFKAFASRVRGIE